MDAPEELWLTQEEYERIAAPDAARMAAVVGIVLAVAVESPWGRASTGVAPGWIAAITAVWLLLSVYGTSMRSSWARFAAPVSSSRDVETHVTMLYCVCFGATSSFDASPGYALVAAAVANLGSLRAYRQPVTMGIVALTPLALRLVAVPGASDRSLAIAAAVGVATVIGIVVWGRRVERDHAVRVGLVHELQRMTELRAFAEHRHAAMSLHDGLSGAVLVLEARLAGAASYAAIADVVSATLAIVRGMIVGRTLADLDGLAQELKDGGPRFGVEAEIEVAPSAHELPRDEQRDLSELGWEAAMNALRAGARRLALTVTADADAVTLTCIGSPVIPGGTAPSGRRGLRNAQWRAGSRGGEVSLDVVAGRFVARWPRRVRALDDRWIAPATFAVIALGGVGFAAISGEWLALWLTAYGALGASAALAAMSSNARSARERLQGLALEERTLSERERIVSVLNVLVGPTHALEQADARGSLESARAAARELASSVSEAIRRLEAA